MAHVDDDDLRLLRGPNWVLLASRLPDSGLSLARQRGDDAVVFRGEEFDSLACAEKAKQMTDLGYVPAMTAPADPAALADRLEARERHDKPAHADVPAEERARRAERAAVERRLAALPLANAAAPVPQPAVPGA